MPVEYRSFIFPTDIYLWPSHYEPDTILGNASVNKILQSCTHGRRRTLYKDTHTKKYRNANYEKPMKGGDGA